MAPSSRDRISVDLHGLKAAVVARAEAPGVSPSVLVRSLLAEALGRPVNPSAHGQGFGHALRHGGRARLCLRMSRAEASDVLNAARRAGMCPGAFVADLVAGVPVVLSGRGPNEHLAALIASSAELSTLSRNIHHLTSLLRAGEVAPALVYRGMLDTISGDIRRHLLLASSALAKLRPRSQASSAAQRRGEGPEGEPRDPNPQHRRRADPVR